MSTTWPPPSTHKATEYTTFITTHEPNLNSWISFHYVYTTHQMAIRYHTMCYIFTLSGQEQTAVHTDSGLKTLEV
ncbi:hypothetical protein CHS0354_019083 [Potamilus streckersoni]|uniref:Uncharacterized protein n=1 Tax=Potamilus streckersoni TaxID=2493646 RepID=A0AAE0VJX2_9BIVA|nr:hypothetical protein CHS0354_019083 [Potamilus streckersoni]